MSKRLPRRTQESSCRVFQRSTKGGSDVSSDTFTPSSHSRLRVPSCVLAKVSKCIVSLVAASPRRLANLMVVCVVGSPKLHPCSCEAFAFLSESSNRVIIDHHREKRKAWIRPDGFRSQEAFGRTPCLRCFAGKSSVNEGRKRVPVLLTGRGAAWFRPARGISEPWREERRLRRDVLTLANKKNITTTRCELNMTKK